jgi:septin family protein
MSSRTCGHLIPDIRRSSANIRFQEIVGYLERQYDDILAEQSRIKRYPRYRDNRVHALLYFIPPTGHA